MATKEEKQAKQDAIDAQRGALGGGRARAQGIAGGAIGAGPRLRNSGDLSRYNINYTDDPNAAKAKPKAAPKPKATKIARRKTVMSKPKPKAAPRKATTIRKPSTALASKGVSGGRLYEGRGDRYTGMTTAQARTVKPAVKRTTTVKRTRAL